MKNNIDINKSLLEKIDNINKLTADFDILFDSLKDLQSSKINPEQINQLYKLTELYKSIRTEHGSLIMLFEQKKDYIKLNIDDLSSENLNKNYFDLSTFESIIKNVSEILSNIDFEFKRIAIMFPKFMKKNITTMILVVGIDNSSDNFVKIFEEVQNKHPEHIFKIFKSKANKKVNCGNIHGNLNGKDLNIVVKEVPSLFMSNGETIIKLPIENIKNATSFEQFLN
jgi:hypothetical protein